MLVRSLHEDLEKDLGSWTHITSTLTTKISVAHINCLHVNFPPTQIRQYSVVTNELVELQGFRKITNHFRGIYKLYLKITKERSNDHNM